MPQGDAARLWGAVGVVALVVLLAGVASVLLRGIPELRSATGPTTGSGSTTAASPSVTAEPAVPAAGGLVSIDTAAAGHPESAAVVDVLNRHFEAINQGDHATWTGTVTARRAADQPDSRWRADYRSTTDSDVVVTGLASSASGVAVGLRFVSTQDPADAPADLPVGRICWASTWPLTDDGSGLRIDVPARGSTSMSAC
ncbi:hypothetical protein [Pseudonocardia sp. ICBG1034]|uniref:hypothetical protein n=1 Tax=Pseudonocardia sp. ICBG1034 TaxID=2844381 RepID=UPI001CCF4C1F|nr:hypothetical protein [Pseudonocardia sp. ICBG1034]